MKIEDKFEKMAEYILRVNGERNKALIQLALGEFRWALKSEINTSKRLSHDADVNTLIYLKGRSEGMNHDEVKNCLNPNR